MLELSHIDKYYNPGSVNEMCLFNNFNFKVDDGDAVPVVEPGVDDALEEHLLPRLRLVLIVDDWPSRNRAEMSHSG